jgi:hypothetical protein
VDALSTIEEIIRDLLIFVAVMTALLIILIVVVSKMPSDNPLKRVLTALCYRIGATAAVGRVGGPGRADPGPGCALRYRRSHPADLVLVHVLQGCESRHVPSGVCRPTRTEEQGA